MKGAQDLIDTPKKDKSKHKPKRKSLPVLGAKLLKKSKANLDLGVSKKVTKARLPTSQDIDSHNGLSLKKALKKVKSGKVIKKASLQKQQGKKLIKRAKHTVAQSRLRPATRALTAHIESQKLELAKAGSEDYELLTPDDIIILSSGSDQSSQHFVKSTNKSNQKDKPLSSEKKKRKSLQASNKVGILPEKRTRVRADESPVSTRSRTPLSGVESQQTSASGKQSGNKSGKSTATDTKPLDSGTTHKVKVAKQLIKDPGSGRFKSVSKSSTTTGSKSKTACKYFL